MPVRVSKAAYVYCFPVLPKRLASTAFRCFRNGLRLLLSGASKATAIHTAKRYYFIKSYLRLVLHDTELADPVIKGNMRIPDSQGRHKPLIVISAVRTVYHTLMIGLDNSKILKG